MSDQPALLVGPKPADADLVSSVNGETGVVVLDAAAVGADPAGSAAAEAAARAAADSGLDGRLDIAEAAIAGTAEAPVMVTKDADQSVVASTALVDDEDLTLVLDAGRRYVVEAFLIVNGPAAADIKLAWTAPAGATTMKWEAIGLSVSAAGVSGSVNHATQSIGDVAVRATIGTDHSIDVQGEIVVGDAGALTLRWGQSVSDAGSTIVRAGSWLKATPVPVVTHAVTPLADITDVMYLAHRGWQERGGVDVYPENTMVAFYGAVGMGARGIELDWRRTSDGVFVVMHDHTVDRTTDGTGTVSALTAAQIAAMTVDVVAGYLVRVPTAVQVLDKLGLMVNIFAELKDGQETALRTLLNGSYSALKPYMEIHAETSGSVDNLAADGWTVGVIGMEESVATLVAAGVSWVWLSHSDPASPAFAEDARDAGLKVGVYTVNDTANRDVWLARGVDAIVTDDVTLDPSIA